MSEAGEKAAKGGGEKKPKKGAEKSAGTQVAVGEHQRDKNYVPRFKKRYNEVIRPELMKKFGYKNVLQVPRVNKAISTFKITAGRPVGVKVTLRRDQMYEFLDRLVTMALPRVRDFRGVKGKSFDGRGNYAMGLKEHIVFVEIDYDKTETVWGMDIIINTSAKSDAEAMALLKGFQFPFMN